MNLKVTFPEDFPLHGLDRDMFEAKLRDALCFCLYGNTVRQLAERVDARRARRLPDTLPLLQIADEHAFDNCMALDGCRIDDMSVALRRNLLHSVGARIGITLSEWGDSALPALDDPAHQAIMPTEVAATNRQVDSSPSITTPRRPFPVWLAWALGVALVSGVAVWNMRRPAASSASLVATVISTSPAQTLRELASSVPDDRQPYRVSVRIEPQDGVVTHR
ncbi:hypothetical protein B0G71_8204 [Paraburkholderia sp. BL27I4N3]|uniref:hypothetical protein n=1 Tax=Paraburkholderia sp. BL27I4N3 TaxID=1938805 RepID=UPI000E288D3C|nr:hypothetical protein [Paraburkholderia sp. BL27I4N3]REE06526.1 hypothetical protein B0G71_8204 [Paraburkholderia sp. BL27I4N3]